MSVAQLISEFVADNGERTYWKAFNAEDGALMFPHWDIDGHYIQGGRVPIGKWLTAVQSIAPTISGEKYVTGFHVFETREGAEEWTRHNSNRIILPVKCRRTRLKYLHCSENQHKDEPTIIGYVVDEMKVLGDNEDIHVYILRRNL